MLAVIFALALSASPAEQANALHAELLVPVQNCIAVEEPSNVCLETVRNQCVVRLMQVSHSRSSDPFLEAFCAQIESEAWEVARTEADSKLDVTLSKLGETDVQASVQRARKAWEEYRESWCEDESRYAPQALTGQGDLAREACRKALTQDQLVRIRKMINWLNN